MNIVIGGIIFNIGTLALGALLSYCLMTYVPYGMYLIYAVSFVSIILIIKKYIKFKLKKLNYFFDWDFVWYLILTIPLLNIVLIVFYFVDTLTIEYFLPIYEDYLEKKKPDIKCLSCGCTILAKDYYCPLGSSLNTCPECKKDVHLDHYTKRFKHFYVVTEK